MAASKTVSSSLLRGWILSRRYVDMRYVSLWVGFVLTEDFLAYPQQNECAVAESTTYFTRQCRKWRRETFDRCECCAGGSSAAETD